jgi:hypothetical protein
MSGKAKPKAAYLCSRCFYYNVREWSGNSSFVFFMCAPDAIQCALTYGSGGKKGKRLLRLCYIR